MNVWIVNPFDPLPGEVNKLGRYAFLAKVLVEEGHNITWWTSSFSHRFKKYRDKNLKNLVESNFIKNLRINFISVPPYQSNTSFQRVHNHWIYAKNFEKDSIKAVRFGNCSQPDIIIASSPPLYSARKAIRVAKKFNAKVIIDIQDLWPEGFQSFLPSPFRDVSGLFLCPLVQLENANFRQCDGISGVSHDYIDRALCAQKSEKPCAIVYLGVDLSHFDSIAQHSIVPINKKPHDFWVVYIGSVSHNYDLDTLIQAASMVKRRDISTVKIFIIGDGSMLPALKTLSNNMGLDNVQFPGFLGYESMVPFLIHADLAINAIKKESHIAFPNKIFDYCAAGLPIINSIAGGELEKLIKEQNIGLQYIPGDPGSLFEAIMKLHNDETTRKIMSSNSRRLAETLFDKNIGSKRFIKLIYQIVGNNR